MSDMPSVLSEGPSTLTASIEALRQFVIQHWGWNTLILVGVLVATNLSGRIFGAVFNEYVKRFWIKWVHPDEIAKAKAEVSRARTQIEVVQKKAEMAAADVKNFFHTELQLLLAELQRLYEEVADLRFENAWLKAENANLRAEIELLSEPGPDEDGEATFRSEQ